MKKERKRLQFKKEAVANLSKEQMRSVQGGTTYCVMISNGCGSDFTRPRVTVGCMTDFTRPPGTIIIVGP